jgi:hypothetical protein
MREYSCSSQVDTRPSIMREFSCSSQVDTRLTVIEFSCSSQVDTRLTVIWENFPVLHRLTLYHELYGRRFLFLNPFRPKQLPTSPTQQQKNHKLEPSTYLINTFDYVYTKKSICVSWSRLKAQTPIRSSKNTKLGRGGGGKPDCQEMASFAQTVDSYTSDTEHTRKGPHEVWLALDHVTYQQKRYFGTHVFTWLLC